MFSLLKFNIFVFIALIKGLSFQFTDDCFDYNSNGTFGCYVRPGLCKNKDCEYIVKWQDKTTFLNFQIIYRVNDTTINFASVYAALGFSYDMEMGNDSVVMCRVTNNSQTMAVETYFNDNNFKSDTLFNDNRTIGVSNGNITFSDRFIMCSFSRVKSIQGQASFFNLSNPFYILVSFGQTNSLGSPIWHGPNAHDSHVPQNFQSLINADPGTTTVSTITMTTAKATTTFNSGNKININFYLKGLVLLISTYILNSFNHT